jgi:hypothetical protein
MEVHGMTPDALKITKYSYIYNKKGAIGSF